MISCFVLAMCSMDLSASFSRFCFVDKSPIRKLFMADLKVSESKVSVFQKLGLSCPCVFRLKV